MRVPQHGARTARVFPKQKQQCFVVLRYREQGLPLHRGGGIGRGYCRRLKTISLGKSVFLAVALLVIEGTVAASPRSDFLLHCAGCHLPEGTGMPPEVPTLVGSLGVIAASDEGRDYLARVPGASQAPISDARLASVLNWVLMELNNETLPESFKPLTAREVGNSRTRVLSDPLKMRQELWPDAENY